MLLMVEIFTSYLFIVFKKCNIAMPFQKKKKKSVRLTTEKKKKGNKCRYSLEFIGTMLILRDVQL